MFHSSNKIHATAKIGPQVKMGQGNVIGAYCSIEGNTLIGDNNHFDQGVIIAHDTAIGNSNKFYPYVVIGFPGEMGGERDQIHQGTKVSIGNENHLREQVVINAPYYHEATSIGNSCYLMNKSYLAHDVSLANGVTLSAGVNLAGRVSVGDFANLGMGVSVHQRIDIGAYAMVGMQSAVVSHVIPFSLVSGVPARTRKFNLKGVQKKDFKGIDILMINDNFKEIVAGSFDCNNEIERLIKTFVKEHSEKLCEFQS